MFLFLALAAAVRAATVDLPKTDQTNCREAAGKPIGCAEADRGQSRCIVIHQSDLTVGWRTRIDRFKIGWHRVDLGLE